MVAHFQFHFPNITSLNRAGYMVKNNKIELKWKLVVMLHHWNFFSIFLVCVFSVCRSMLALRVGYRVLYKRWIWILAVDIHKLSCTLSLSFNTIPTPKALEKGKLVNKRKSQFYWLAHFSLALLPCDSLLLYRVLYCDFLHISSDLISEDVII